MNLYLFDGYLKVGCFIVELSSDVDVGGPSAHSPARHQAALDQLVRIMPHYLSVLKCVFLPYLKDWILLAFLKILSNPIRQAIKFSTKSCATLCNKNLQNYPCFS
jgi:hypothetical protein